MGGLEIGMDTGEGKVTLMVRLIFEHFMLEMTAI